MIDEHAANVLRALGHPTRLKIMRQLADGERCVCQLVPALGLPQANVSQHLAALRAVGLVTDERRGPYVYYRLASERLRPLLDDLDALVLELLEANARLLVSLKEAK